MATIISLSKHATTVTDGDSMEGSAEIILFPGVQYERHEMPTARRKRHQTRRRDWLELMSSQDQA